MKNPKNIAITGASSGLGAALAGRYAAQGVTLHLHGRHAARLQSVAESCRAKGAAVTLHTGDVTDAAGMKAWLEGADHQAPVDLVIANAGISAGTGGGGETDAQARAIFATNVDGVLNTVQPLMLRMMQRRRGQIALMSSLAGIRGLPSSPAYSASKACVRVYGESLRGWLSHHGVEVSVICPGYVKTPMTDVNHFPMPFILPPEKAADIIVRGLARSRARIAFPFPLYWLLCCVAALPISWSDPIFANLPEKPSL